MLVLDGGAPVNNILVLGFMTGASINGMQAFIYAVAAHSYPTEIRGSAVGLAQTVSRIGAVASPMVASAYLEPEATRFDTTPFSAPLTLPEGGGPPQLRFSRTGSQITLALGQSATCTIVNDDQPN